MADTDLVQEGPVKRLIESVKAAINAKPSLGTTATTAKRGDWTPTVADVSDAGTIGRSLMRAQTDVQARSLIGAITSSDVISGGGGGTVTLSPIDYVTSYTQVRGSGTTTPPTSGGGNSGVLSGYVVEGD